MARRVFFSFHYERDVWRIMQVRNSWLIRPGHLAQPFYDAAEFEEAKRRVGGIKNWIDEQLRGTSVTVVLYGNQTYERQWVRHEIKRSYELNKGIVAVSIHNIKDRLGKTDKPGKNPLDYWHISDVPLSECYKSYDWILNDGRQNLSMWIETAAAAVGR